MKNCSGIVIAYIKDNADQNMTGNQKNYIGKTIPVYVYKSYKDGYWYYVDSDMEGLFFYEHEVILVHSSLLKVLYG